MGIRLSENQMEGHQIIRTSGEIYLLICWYSDNRALIFRYPDNLFTDG